MCVTQEDAAAGKKWAKQRNNLTTFTFIRLNRKKGKKKFFLLLFWRNNKNELHSAEIADCRQSKCLFRKFLYFIFLFLCVLLYFRVVYWKGEIFVCHKEWETEEEKKVKHFYGMRNVVAFHSTHTHFSTVALHCFVLCAVLCYVLNKVRREKESKSREKEKCKKK